MHEHVTFLRPAAPSSAGHGISSAFPPEVLEQVRSRVRLLCVLMFVAFAFDLVIYLGTWLAILAGYPAPDSFFETGAFQVFNAVAVAASAGLWWVARSRHVSASRLHTLGLAYEVTICFIIATITFWQLHVLNQKLPNLTWVLRVILFPLVMPGRRAACSRRPSPPERWLGRSSSAGVTGKVAGSEAYFQVTVQSAFAVGFAYSGAQLAWTWTRGDCRAGTGELPSRGAHRPGGDG